ncbi:MAG: hypothetical protein SWH61_12725 [Thermodesulfobacteriota bacterium]|nr:hypothetical protein [Thermodesulfobacteriota bacterium]
MRSEIYVVATITLLLMTAVAGCGRKAMPVPPGAFVPPRVSDLQARLDGKQTILDWTLPDGEKARKRGLTHFRIFRSARALDTETVACADCAAPFKPLATLSVNEMEETESGAFIGKLEDAPASGFLYTYFVRGYTAVLAGPPSNNATVKYLPEDDGPISGDPQ